jgi:hypothetical protein
MSAAPIVAERNEFEIKGASKVRGFSSKEIKTVVRVEPTRVFIAMLLPKITSARISRAQFITNRMTPGENLMNEVSITLMPLVPPSKSDLGKINRTVLIEYTRLPKRINRYSVSVVESFLFVFIIIPALKTLKS